MKLIIFVANRMRLILLVYILSLACSAFLFATFESKTLWEGLWWSVVTALTIGYGDFAPVTIYGRLTGIIFGHFWIFGIIPMIIGNIVSKMLEDKNKFTHAEQEWQEATLIAIAKAVQAKVDDPPADY